ncbi:MAG: 1,2-phenylacetyl-CoA epoxidase subunit PaaD [Casimicrobiaceae bacterium]
MEPAVTATACPLPSTAEAWTILGRVMDPEVPVVSIVELGIVRDVGDEVERGQRRLRVTITPTYSGCPAMDMIATDIRAAFAHAGAAVDIVTTLAPAWTTDWMAPEAKARLAAFGIAPPQALARSAPQSPASRIDVTGISPLRRRKDAVACPHCRSGNTSLIAQFGSAACKALYRCDDCREPFDYFKPH